MTNCSLILVALSLIGLGLGDSPLVILSLCSLVLFFVISFSFALFVFLFFSFSFLFVCVPLCTLWFALCFHEVLFEYIFSYLSKKKYKNTKIQRKLITKERAKEHKDRITKYESPSLRPIKKRATK